MYCVEAPATHYFPVSIPYHGCALNMTVQSYLDQLDFGLVACSKTVPDAQRIADYIAEDFAAMRKADAELSSPGAIETIAVAPTPGPLSAHKPITLGEAKVEPRAQKAEKTSALTQRINALGEATEALLRRLERARPAAPAKTRAAKKAATPRERAVSEAGAAERCRLRMRRPVRSGRGPKPQGRPRGESTVASIRCRRRIRSRSFMADPLGDIPPPSALLLALEPRGIFGIASLFAAAPFLARPRAPRRSP